MLSFSKNDYALNIYINIQFDDFVLCFWHYKINHTDVNKSQISLCKVFQAVLLNSIAIYMQYIVC